MLFRSMSVKPAHVEDVHREYLTFDELQRLAKTECPYPVLKDAFLFSCLTGNDDITRNIVGSCRYDKDKLDRLLEETELKTPAADNIEGKTAEELSTGLLQRMVIARALYQIGDKDILIIDEGFSALDIDMRPKMYRLVKKYQQKYDLTVLDITHNFDEREEFDEVIMVEGGRVSLK